MKPMPIERSGSRPLVFLGGTCGNSQWRETFTDELVDGGIPKAKIFNPVVADWTEECQTREDEAKRTAKFVLFNITDPEEKGNPISAYSIVEAVMGMYDNPERTLVVFDTGAFSNHALRSIQKTEKDLKSRFPSGRIFSDLSDCAEFIIEQA
jgi:hypothetical protein